MSSSNTMTPPAMPLEQLEMVVEASRTLVDARREPRFVLLGDVSITVSRPLTRVVKAELCDVSNHGFRASYSGELISTGSEVTFTHQLFQGKARVVWSRHLPEGNQSGFYILRD